MWSHWLTQWWCHKDTFRILNPFKFLHKEEWEAAIFNSFLRSSCVRNLQTFTRETFGNLFRVIVYKLQHVSKTTRTRQKDYATSPSWRGWPIFPNGILSLQKALQESRKETIISRTKLNKLKTRNFNWRRSADKSKTKINTWKKDRNTSLTLKLLMRAGE